jgi:predicted transcriptional regulator
MPRAARDIPPPLELACLKALWKLREGTVKDVRDIVAQSRPLAYTTIMTVLDRLVRKGKLARRKVGRAFLYSPRAPRDAMCRAAVRELLDNFFDGSEAELIQFLRGPERGPEGTPVPAPAPAERPERIDTVLL